MKTFIALLRGINVGGHRKAPMLELRNLLTDLSFKNVKTYIQSGNVVFQSEDDSSKILENKIQETIKSHFGFDVLVLIKTCFEFQDIFNKSPFQNPKLEHSYFMFLGAKPLKANVAEISVLSSTVEEFYITDNCIYFFAENGYGKAKYNSNFFERKLKVDSTARNYKTMLKLLTMATDIKTKP